MTTLSDNYMVALDPEVGFCRLFRVESIEGAGLSPLWSGLGLRAGYDAMIRLNNDRRPVPLYRVCSKPARDGEKSFRLLKSKEPMEPWTMVSAHTDYDEAKSELARLTGEREARRTVAKDALLKTLQRVGLKGQRIPRLSATDRRYIEWLKETGRVAA